MNAIIDFSNMPVLVSRNLHHYFIYRHTLSLFIGLVAFLFALRYGVHFNKYYLYFLGLGGLLALLPFYNGPHHIKAFRRWFECGELLIRVGPAILLLLLPALCVFCDRVEKNIDIKKASSIWQ
jgi:cell division protein FtsW (lipid II flippase)